MYVYTMKLAKYFPCVIAFFVLVWSRVTEKNYVLKYDQNTFPLWDMKIKSPSGVSCAAICNKHKMCSYYSYNDDDTLCVIHSNLEGETTLISELKWRIYKPVFTHCPYNWELFEGHCYFFSQIQRSWHDSKVYCEGQQSMLVEVYSENEKNFLKGKAMKYRSSFWIGATDFETEDVWKWNTTQTMVTVTDWSPGQPDNYLGNQDCVQIMTSEGYRWDDNLCEALRAFSCEMLKF